MIKSYKPKPKFCYCCLLESSDFCVDKTKNTHKYYGFCRSCLKDYTLSERRVKQRAFVFNALKTTGLLNYIGEL